MRFGKRHVKVLAYSIMAAQAISLVSPVVGYAAETVVEEQGISSHSEGVELSNDYASAILYEDEKRLVVTGFLKQTSYFANYPWMNSDGTSKVDGFTVEIAAGITRIGQAAFVRSGIVGTLVIPDSVTTIEKEAFLNCTGLTGDLIIPNSVTSIGESAFKGCSGFKGGLVIPNSVATIGNSAFSSCSGFSGDLVIPDSVKSIGSTAFGFCSGFDGNLVLSSSLEEIPFRAFINCSGLTGNLTIPDSVVSIGNSAFSGCSGFTGDLIIPNLVTSIGELAFNGCKGFDGSLIIPDSVTIISEGVFKDCSGFKGNLTISNNAILIDREAFSGCSGFTGDLVIPNEVTIINQGAFTKCKGFNGELRLSDSLEEIGRSAFNNCSGFIGDLIIPDSVRTIGTAVFQNCSGFNGNLKISSSITKIDQDVFNGCSGLTGTLSIPESVNTIGFRAFMGCKGFEGDLIIPDSVTTIETSAFSNCSGFTGKLKLPNTITIINNSFAGCSSLTGDLIIPDSVTSIGNSAFNKCSSLGNTLVIPSSITSLGANTFNGCGNITSIQGGDNLTSIATGCFGVSKLTPTVLNTNNNVLLSYPWTFSNRELVSEDNKVTVTIYKELYDTNNTLISKEEVSSEELSVGDSYHYTAPAIEGYSISGQSEYQGLVESGKTYEFVFKYVKTDSKDPSGGEDDPYKPLTGYIDHRQPFQDVKSKTSFQVSVKDLDEGGNGVLGGELVVSIPAEMKLTESSSDNEYLLKADAIYARGRVGAADKLTVTTATVISYVNEDDSSVTVPGEVIFGVTSGSDQVEEWKAAELVKGVKEGEEGSVSKDITVRARKDAIDYKGGYSTVLLYNIEVV